MEFLFLEEKTALCKIHDSEHPLFHGLDWLCSKQATVLATMPVQFGNIWTHCTAKNVISVLDNRIVSIFVKQ